MTRPKHASWLPLTAVLALWAWSSGLTACGGGRAAHGGREANAASTPTGAATAPTGAATAPTRTAAAPRRVAEPNRTVGQFGRRGTGPGELQEPFGIGVDDRSGAVYVVDTTHARVEKFTSGGRFLRAWGWGVADGRTPAPQVCTRRCFAGIAGAGGGQFDFPEGVAVDNSPRSASSGDVYVADLHNHRVEKFDPDGRFLLAFGDGVNRSAHRHGQPGGEDVCRASAVCGRGREGSARAALELNVEGSFIAVDRRGSALVGERNAVKAFSPQGTYRSRIPLAPAPSSDAQSRESGGVSGLALDGANDMYVIRHGVAGVNEYSPQGRLLRTIEPAGGEPAYPEGPTPSLALAPGGNVFIDVYADEEHRIDEYDPRGVRIASFDRGPKAPPAIADREDGLPGMAYNPRTRRLYVVNADVNVRPVVERVRMVAPPRP